MQIGEFVKRKREGDVGTTGLPGPAAKSSLPQQSPSGYAELNLKGSGTSAAQLSSRTTTAAATESQQRRGVIASQRGGSSGGGSGNGAGLRPAGGGSGYRAGGGGYSTAANGRAAGYAAASAYPHKPSHWDQFLDQASQPPHYAGGSRATYSRQTAPAVARSRPLGMANLGNTCYMNATLQVLLSLRPFVADLDEAARRAAAGAEAAGAAAAGVVQALQRLAQAMAAADRVLPGGDSLRPEALKEALERRISAFQGTLQQDAHEFLCAVLEQLQAEVVRREVAAVSSRRVALSATACPAARNFGFCIEHQVTCSRCGRESRLQEQFMHLSLELPPGVDEVARLHTQTLLQDHLQDEEVEKSCEGCGAENVPHAVHHVLRRLPRVLALHFKRFRAQLGPNNSPRFRKMHTRIAVPDSLQLSSVTDACTRPPLPLGHKSAPLPASSGGREKQQKAASITPRPANGAADSPAAPLAPLPTRKRASEEEVALEEAKRRSIFDSHDASLCTPGAPIIRAGSGGSASADALLCAEEGAAGSGSSAGGGGGESDDIELQSTIKASREEAQAAEDAMLARATAASLAETTSPSAVACPTAAVDLTAVDDGGGDAVPAGKPPPDWFEIVEDDAAAAAPPGSPGVPLKATYSLRGVINHLGSGPSSGHFTADVLDAKARRWFRHNDSVVAPINPSDPALQRSRDQTAYMLVYVADGL